MTRRWVRWMPAAAMPAIVAGVVLAGPIQAQAPVHLSAKTAGQVLALMAGSKVQALSGTLEQTVDLGLPQLPAGITGSTSAPGSSSGTGSAAGLGQLVEALTQPHTVRVYLDGAGNQRVQVLDAMAERDVVRRGDVVWTYDSATNTATQITLPNPKRPLTATPGPELPGDQILPGTAPRAPVKAVPHYKAPDSVAQTPATIAADIMKNLDPGTTVSVGANLLVANQPAYDLQLVPKTAGTLVGRVSIAVDANNGMPLRVTVLAKGQDKPAFEVGFSHLTLTTPPASMFTFTPPPGATVTKQALPLMGLPGSQLTPGPHGSPILPTGAASQLTTSGTGWSTIVATPAHTVPAGMTDSPALAQLLQTVQGGRALSTSLFNVLVTPTGALYAGAVPLAALQQAAAAK